MLKKPPHGSPCNGCGGCCVDQRCPLSAHLFGPGGQCPALEMRFPAFTCGLVNRPERYAPEVTDRHGIDAARRAAFTLVGAGFGCDALERGERRNEAWAARVRKSLDMDAARRAAIVWGVDQ